MGRELKRIILNYLIYERKTILPALLAKVILKFQVSKRFCKKHTLKGTHGVLKNRCVKGKFRKKTDFKRHLKKLTHILPIWNVSIFFSCFESSKLQEIFYPQLRQMWTNNFSRPPSIGLYTFYVVSLFKDRRFLLWHSFNDEWQLTVAESYGKTI